MALAHVTQTGNISIPKKWRTELGIKPNSNVVIKKTAQKIIIEPINGGFESIDEEMDQKKIKFSMEESIQDDLYD